MYNHFNNFTIFKGYILRSDEVKKGYDRAPHRSLLRATGLKDEDFNKPFIGVANSFIEIIPGHFFLDKVSKIIKDGGESEMGDVYVSGYYC